MGSRFTYTSCADLGSNLWLQDSILTISVLVVIVISIILTELSVSLIGLLMAMAQPVWPFEGNVAAF